jgi:hypothetical protein
MKIDPEALETILRIVFSNAICAKNSTWWEDVTTEVSKHLERIPDQPGAET